jgi:plastocyanin
VTTNFQFVPAQLTVKVDDQVEYRNQDKAAHTVSQGRDGKRDDDAAFDEKLPRDSAITIKFAKAGTFGVTCTIHPTMNQVVTVTP